MSFGGFLDNKHAVAGDGGGTGTAATNAAAVPYKLTFSSPGLSLALVRRMSESYEPGVGGGGGGRRRSREEENESKSGSDNMDGGGGGSGEDIDGADDGKPPRKKRYYRHTPYQIQELEKLFKECPHLDDKQRLEVSRRLCLETRQVKSWFRKRRTQIRNKWAEMFPCLISRTSTIDVISSGMGGTRNGALQLMHAELQVLSPLVPVREVNFLRFCKQHAEGVWAVVEVSIDTTRENAPALTGCRRLPSGCVIQDMPNGYSKVTWVEHAEYDENAVHELYKPLIQAGMGFGAQRWVATLQRQCECLAVLMSYSVLTRYHTAITTSGQKSILKLAQRMIDNFCAGVCASSAYKWNTICSTNVDKDVRVMTRQSVNDPGEPSGVVLSAATSVWLPVSPQRLFDFLRDERLRSEWDILSSGGPMQEMAHIAKGQDHGNRVSLLRANAQNPKQSNMLILQETCTDSTGSLVVYAPVDIPAMHAVTKGGDPAYVALLPSGFAIVPDGPCNRVVSEADNGGVRGDSGGGGALLTVAFQILVKSLPTAKLTVESVETVNNLIWCTVQKIKAAALPSEN